MCASGVSVYCSESGLVQLQHDTCWQQHSFWIADINIILLCGLLAHANCLIPCSTHCRGGWKVEEERSVQWSRFLFSSKSLMALKLGHTHDHNHIIITGVDTILPAIVDSFVLLPPLPLPPPLSLLLSSSSSSFLLLPAMLLLLARQSVYRSGVG